MSASEDFAQLKLKFIDPIQYDYEAIRPIVLFAETIAERSRQTGIERTVVGDKAKRFVQLGMLGLQDQRGQTDLYVLRQTLDFNLRQDVYLPLIVK